jgi:hypothetical protein
VSRHGFLLPPKPVVNHRDDIKTKVLAVNKKIHTVPVIIPITVQINSNAINITLVGGVAH